MILYYSDRDEADGSENDQSDDGRFLELAAQICKLAVFENVVNSKCIILLFSVARYDAPICRCPYISLQKLSELKSKISYCHNISIQIYIQYNCISLRAILSYIEVYRA